MSLEPPHFTALQTLKSFAVANRLARNESSKERILKRIEEDSNGAWGELEPFTTAPIPGHAVIKMPGHCRVEVQMELWQDWPIYTVRGERYNELGEAMAIADYRVNRAILEHENGFSMSFGAIISCLFKFIFNKDR